MNCKFQLNARRYARSNRIVEYAYLAAKAGKRTLIWTGSEESKKTTESAINAIDPDILLSGMLTVECVEDNIKCQEYELAIINETVPYSKDPYERMKMYEAEQLDGPGLSHIKQRLTNRVGRFPTCKDKI